MATAGSLENTYNLSVNVPIRSIIITTWYLAIIGSFHRRWFTCITIQDIEKDKIRLISLLVLHWAFTSRKIIKKPDPCKSSHRGTCLSEWVDNTYGRLEWATLLNESSASYLLFLTVEGQHKPILSHVLWNRGMFAFKCRRLLSWQFGRNCQINECRK